MISRAIAGSVGCSVWTGTGGAGLLGMSIMQDIGLLTVIVFVSLEHMTQLVVMRRSEIKRADNQGCQLLQPKLDY
jgi:hypothetical protein